MDVQDFRSLQEAYMEVVINEAKKPFPFEKVANKSKSKEKQKLQLKKDVEGGLISHKRATPLSSKLVNQKVKMDMVWAKEREKKKEDDNSKRSPTFYRKDKHLSKMTKTQREQVDIYDIILSHLLDEGYAETPEAAEAIMVNMSEDWREDIVEGYKELPVGKMRKQVIKHAASGTKRAFMSKFRGQKGTTAGNVEDAKAMKSLNKAKKIQGEIEKRKKMGSDFYQGSREGRAISNRNRGR